MDSIFITMYGYKDDWIVGKIAYDIQRVAESLGYSCRCGEREDYKDEDICYHISYHWAVPNPRAKYNSVFCTHIDDALKEKLLYDMKDKFDSFICMSKEDAEFLLEIGFDKRKVFGKSLPVRNNYIKPISIGIFSACYPDWRKNEQWLIDYCKDNERAKLVNFVFIGRGWEKVVKELSDLDCSYEWHNVSRNLPYEYQYQQNKLASLNYYIYMGMDGGAMGTYDAYAQDVPLCVTYDGFHKTIPDIDYSFDDEKSFFEQFDSIISKQERRIDFFKRNSPDNYCRWLISVWNGNILSNGFVDESEKKCISFDSITEKRRGNYFDITLLRIRNYLVWKLFKLRH